MIIIESKTMEHTDKLIDSMNRTGHKAHMRLTPKVHESVQTFKYALDNGIMDRKSGTLNYWDGYTQRSYDAATIAVYREMFSTK